MLVSEERIVLHRFVDAGTHLGDDFFVLHIAQDGFYHLGIENDMRGDYRLLGLKPTTNHRFGNDCYAAPLDAINA